MKRYFSTKILVLLILAASVVGCGSSGGDSTTTNTGNTGSGSNVATWDNFNWDDGSTWQ